MCRKLRSLAMHLSLNLKLVVYSSKETERVATEKHHFEHKHRLCEKMIRDGECCEKRRKERWRKVLGKCY